MAGRDDEAPLPAPATELDRIVGVGLAGDDAAVVGELTDPAVLVTHCQEHLTDPVLDALNIRDWFDAVVCCTEEIGWKPDPRPVHMALREAGAESGDGVLVGDGPHDVGAAWNAGLDGAHVERHGYARRGR
jgi:phosphoglycolate phosphatase